MEAAFQPPHIYEAIEVDDSLRINPVRPIMTPVIELVNRNSGSPQKVDQALMGSSPPLVIRGGA